MKLGNILVIYYRQARNHRLKGISLIVLCTIAIVMIHMAVFELVKSRYDIITIKSFFPERENLYNISIWITDAGDVTDAEIQAFIDTLGKIEGVRLSGKYYFVNREFEELREESTFINYNEKIVEGTERDGYPTLLDICYVDRSIVSILNLQELSNMKHGDIIPVFVGESYRNYFKEGDIYTDDMGCRYQICGVLPKGFQIPPTSLFGMGVPYENMDDKLVALYDKKVDPNNLFIGNSTQSIYCITDGTLETEQRIEELAKNCFIHIELKTVDQRIEDYKQKQKWYLQITALYTGIMVLGAFLAMVSSSIIQIILKKREYGIFYANGISRFDSIRLIAVENGIHQGAAYLIATMIAMRKIQQQSLFHALQQLEIFKDMVVLKTLLIVIVLFMISTVIPVWVLNRMKTAEMLGGNEL